MPGELLDRALIYVTGKGGVGKTTVAAALGLAAAARGRRTIVCEVAEQSHMSRAFAHAGVSRDREARLAPDLYAVTVDPQHALEEWLGRQVGGSALRIMTRSQAFNYFVAAAPGAKELITIAKVWELAQLERWSKSNRTYDLVIVDGPRRAPDPAQRRALLDAWERELGAPRHPVARALVDAGERHRLPLEELHTYMGSMRIDCGPVRIGTYAELEAYMDGSAGTVGRIMGALLGIHERHRADFGRLGQAFQLTNFIRDVREDHRLDRVYLPGALAHDLEAPSAGPELRALVAHEVERARGLFAACEGAVRAAPRAVQPGMRLAIAVYRAVLDRVERSGYDVLGGRTVPRPWELAAGALGR